MLKLSIRGRRWFGFRSALRGPSYTVLILHALFVLSCSVLAQGTDAGSEEDAIAERVSRAQLYGSPFSVELPAGWEVLPPSESDTEKLHLVRNGGEHSDGVATMDVHPLQGGWEELVKRQTYHLVVVVGADLFHREPLTLNGWRGYKWIYYASDSAGTRRLFYRLYLALPSELSERRLLVFQGSVTPAEQSADVATFNALVSSLRPGP